MGVDFFNHFGDSVVLLTVDIALLTVVACGIYSVRTSRAKYRQQERLEAKAAFKKQDPWMVG